MCKVQTWKRVKGHKLKEKIQNPILVLRCVNKCPERASRRPERVNSYGLVDFVTACGRFGRTPELKKKRLKDGANDPWVYVERPQGLTFSRPRVQAG